MDEGPRRRCLDNDTDNNDEDDGTCHCVCRSKLPLNKHTRLHGCRCGCGCGCISGLKIGQNRGGTTSQVVLASCHCVLSANWRHSLSQMDTHKAAQSESDSDASVGYNCERGRVMMIKMRSRTRPAVLTQLIASYKTKGKLRLLRKCCRMVIKLDKWRLSPIFNCRS